MISDKQVNKLIMRNYAIALRERRSGVKSIDCQNHTCIHYACCKSKLENDLYLQHLKLEVEARRVVHHV